MSKKASRFVDPNPCDRSDFTRQIATAGRQNGYSVRMDNTWLDLRSGYASFRVSPDSDAAVFSVELEGEIKGGWKICSKHQGLDAALATAICDVLNSEAVLS